MEIKKIKKKYDSGDYICVMLPYNSDTWTVIDSVFDGTAREYKLIHNHHKEVLEHYLKGGEIEVLFFGTWKDKTLFIKTYNEDQEYRIKNTETTRTFNSKRELAEVLMWGEKWYCDEIREGNTEYYCYYDDSKSNFFRYGTAAMCLSWNYCNGKTLWHRVEEKETVVMYDGTELPKPIEGEFELRVSASNKSLTNMSSVAYSFKSFEDTVLVKEWIEKQFNSK